MVEAVNVQGYGTNDLRSLQGQITAELLRRESLPRQTDAKLYSHVSSEGKPRLLTTRESLLARINDYERLSNSRDDRLRLFRKGFWTSAGILWEYPGNKSIQVERRRGLIPERAKIKEVDPELLRLEPGHGSYVPIEDFDSFEGELLDLTEGFWNTPLYESQVPEHPGWRKLIGDDKEGRQILRGYARIVFSEVQRQYRETAAMTFYTMGRVINNEFWEPWVSSLSVRYGTYCYSDLAPQFFVSGIPTHRLGA